jgi:hypothetical protein
MWAEKSMIGSLTRWATIMSGDGDSNLATLYQRAAAWLLGLFSIALFAWSGVLYHGWQDARDLLLTMRGEVAIVSRDLKEIKGAFGRHADTDCHGETCTRLRLIEQRLNRIDGR